MSFLSTAVLSLPAEDRAGGEEEQEAWLGALDARHGAPFPKHPDVLAGVQYVEDGEVPAALEHAHHLPQGLLALGRSVDVVQHETREDHVEGLVGKWQPMRVSVHNVRALGDPFEPRVL